VTRETTERPVKLVHLDPPESQVPLDHLEREDHLELLDLREGKERRERRERVVWKVRQERQVPSALRELLASPVLKASGEYLVQWESKVYLVPPAQTDLQDPWDPQDYLV